MANRLQKVLEWANLKLTSVATDVLGKSGRAMLDAIVDGQSDVATLAALAQGRMRAKRAALEQALEGRVRDHHRFLIAQHLEHVDFVDEQIAAFDRQITALIEPTEEASTVLPAMMGRPLQRLHQARLLHQPTPALPR